MIPYFEYVIYIIFLAFGLIIGILISKRVKIQFKLTTDPITNAAYTILVAFSGIMVLLIVFNSISSVANIELPFFLQTSAIDVLKAIGPVFIGAITVFLMRKQKIEDREKEISEKLASPVFLEIEKIQDDLLGEQPQIFPTAKNYFEKWEGIKGTRLEIESLSIDDTIDDFYTNVKNYLVLLEKIGSKMIYTMNKSFQGIVLSKQSVHYKLNLTPTETFEVKYWSLIEWKKLPLIKHIILGINSIEWVKMQDKALTDENIKIKILAPSETIVPEDKIEFTYSEIKSEFDEFIRYMIKTMSVPENTKGMKQLKDDLLLESNRLFDSLGNYI